MFHHFIDNFFNNEILNNTEYKISKNKQNEIEKIIKYNKKTMLISFGRPLIDIQKYYLSFKAEEQYNWIILYSLLLLQNHLPEK